MFKKIIVVALALFAALSTYAAELNKATQAELESISGIGPAMSSRILDERKKSSFKDWSDFSTRVKGVGAKTAAKFSKAGLTVNGVAYEGSPAAASAVKKSASNASSAKKK